MAGKITGSPRGEWRGQLGILDQDTCQKVIKKYKNDFLYVGPYSIQINEHSVIKQGTTRPGILSICQQQIDSCNLVLARIDGHDLYGTYAEIGIATQSGKRIILDIQPSLAKDMWFLVELALQNLPSNEDFFAVKDFITFIPQYCFHKNVYIMYLESLMA